MLDLYLYCCVPFKWDSLHGPSSEVFSSFTMVNSLVVEEEEQDDEEEEQDGEEEEQEEEKTDTFGGGHDAAHGSTT